MLSDEMEEFLSHLGEISSDSVSADTMLRTQKNENKKLRSQLVSMKESSKEVLTMYKNERQITIKLQEKLDNSNLELQKMREQFNELERTDLNKVFHLTELMNEMKRDIAQEHSDYVELCKDYFELLSETTCFFNYEIKKKSQNKIITTTEKFLYSVLGDAYKKPKILRSKRTKSEEDEVTTTARSSSRISKRSASKSSSISESKKRKTEIWDMKSISQASSPAATFPFADEETSDLSSEICEAESSASFNTFSIGNETSFSFLQSQKSSPMSGFQCKCHLYPDSGPTLVSTGTNTEPPEEEIELPSIQSLLHEDIDLLLNENECSLPSSNLKPEISNDTKEKESSHEVLVKETTYTTSSTNTEPEIYATEEISIEQEMSPAIVTNAKVLVDRGTSPEVIIEQGTSPELATEVKKTIDRGTSPEIFAEVKQTVDRGTSPEVIAEVKEPVVQEVSPKIVVKLKETVEQGTSPELVATSHKSTATVRSSTTRGTSTNTVVTKSCGIQFPEISIEKIFSETIFDLPDIILPIQSIDDQDDVLEMKSVETMTELSNVNREISYTIKSVVKPEIPQSDDLLCSQDLEDKSFVILGQTLFDLFMKRFHESNELTDDEITRKKIWKHLKRQLVDRFSELTFDDTLNLSLTDNDVCAPSFNESVEIKCNKEGYQSTVVEKERDIDMERDEQELPTLVVDKEAKSLEDDLVQIAQPTTESIAEPETQKFNSCLSEVDENDFEMSELDEQGDFETSELDQKDRKSLEDFDKTFETLKALYSMPESSIITPINDLSDVIWSSLFPEEDQLAEDGISESDVLEGFEVDHEPIEIPIDVEVYDEVAEIFKEPVQTFTEFDTPKSPPPFVQIIDDEMLEDVPEIPTNESKKMKNSSACSSSVLTFDPQVNEDMKFWQSRRKIASKKAKEELVKTKKALKLYLQADWTDENLEICLKDFASINENVIVESLYETVEENKLESEINSEFTPPAPPLPRYQQKLILLIKKLTETNQKLPHLLVTNLEEKLFRFDNSTISVEDLRNFAYYYAAIIDLFFDGDSTIVLYFIVKCVYYFGYKSVSMVFVLLKSFPDALPKKSQLLKMYSKDIDWENMSGQELSKVHLNLEWMDSLDLTVIYVLIFMQKDGPRAKQDFIGNHELYPFIQKYYGFFLNLMTPQKLMELLMKRLEEGHIKNFSLSMILLAKRSKSEFTLKTMVKEHLIPTLNRHIDQAGSSSGDKIEPVLVSQICALIESTSVIIKAFPDEKDLSFRQIFPILVSTISRLKSKKVQEYCIKAILRLQRFMTNHKDVYSIIKAHVENVDRRMNDSLQFAIQTFVHRKGQEFFKEII